MYCEHCGGDMGENKDKCPTCGKITEERKEELKTNTRVFMGYLSALLLPPMGIIVGITLLKRDEKNAYGVLALSIAALLIIAIG